MNKHKPQSYDFIDHGKDCTSISTQYTDIHLPVKVKPWANIGEVQTDCCGDPIVTLHKACGCGWCEITIMQQVCITIPVEYTTTVEMGELAVNCKRPQGIDCKPYR